MKSYNTKTISHEITIDNGSNYAKAFEYIIRYCITKLAAVIWNPNRSLSACCFSCKPSITMCKICSTYKSRETGCVGFCAFAVFVYSRNCRKSGVGGLRQREGRICGRYCLYAYDLGNIPRSRRCIPQQ